MEIRFDNVLIETDYKKRWYCYKSVPFRSIGADQVVKSPKPRYYMPNGLYKFTLPISEPFDLQIPLPMLT